MRVTRKMAAEVAEALHVDDDDDVALASGNENIPSNIKDQQSTEEQLSRAPLGELEPNSADNTSQSEDTVSDLKKSTRGGRNGTKKGGKGKKNNHLAASVSAREDPSTNPPEVLPDHDDRTPSPASEQAAEDLIKDASSTPTIPAEHPSSIKNATPAVKVTRNRSAKHLDTPVEPKSLMDGIGQLPEERESMMEEQANANGIPAIANTEELPTEALPIDAPPSPLPNAVPKPVAHLRTETPAKRSTSNKENVEPHDMESPSARPTNYDILEDAVVAAATPPSTSPAQPEDPIAALDNLDEAVESVSKDIPDVQSSPEKPKSKESVEKKTTKKAAPVVRPTKASQARITLSQNPDTGSKAPTLGRPRPSTTLGRSNSVRQSENSGKRVPSNSSALNASTSPTSAEKKEVIIPHSKPRPVSLSFRAPFQPTKSTKAPTQSTFQLPGEAVAAKLKAAREARALKEIEEKKPTFKARPVPSSMLSRAPSVRQTTSSRARESIMTGREAKVDATTAPHQRAQSVATSRPSISTTTKPRPISQNLSATKLATSTITRPTSSAKPIKARPMSALATSSKPRPSTSPASTTTTTTAGVGKGTLKGKEVFNRAATAKAAAEKQKLEKEAAAKKARADAAERGRVASREWAEKQKRIAAAKKAATSSSSMTVVSAASVDTLAQTSSNVAGVDLV